MKIVNERGTVVTSREFRDRLGKLVSFVVNGFHQDAPTSHQEVQSQALHQAELTGLDITTRAGQAAAGAAMIAATLEAGICEFERKNHRSIPRAVMLELQDKISQLPAIPAKTAQPVVNPVDLREKLTPPPTRGEPRRLGDL